MTRVVREGNRGYADYWDWRLDRTRTEMDAAQVLYNFLEGAGERISGLLLPVEQDPPDVLLTTVDGRRLGIEVTELVDSDTTKRHSKRKKRGLDAVEDWAEWTPISVGEGLTSLVDTKDRKLAKAAGDYDELLLAIVTDEPMIDEGCARRAVALCRPTAKLIGRAFLLMSYHPGTDLAAYPDGCLVLPIPLSR